MENNTNDLFDSTKTSMDNDDNHPPVVDSTQRIIPDNISIGSPSTASPSVRSLTLSPEEERGRTTRTSIQLSRNNTRPRASSNDNTATIIGPHLTNNTTFYDIPVVN